MNPREIFAQLPYKSPFLFVDHLREVNEDGCCGTFRFRAALDFYKGHFIDNPITPGVILTECCAQIGLVCLGIYLHKDQADKTNQIIAMSSSEMEFYLPVYPGEQVEVRSEKIYYRFNKLKCAVKMYNEENVLVCKGILAGMLKPAENE